MNTEEKCIMCNNQNIVNENHVRSIDGELIRLCPICYHSMTDCTHQTKLVISQ